MRKRNTVEVTPDPDAIYVVVSSFGRGSRDYYAGERFRGSDEVVSARPDYFEREGLTADEAAAARKRRVDNESAQMAGIAWQPPQPKMKAVRPFDCDLVRHGYATPMRVKKGQVFPFDAPVVQQFPYHFAPADEAA